MSLRLVSGLALALVGAVGWLGEPLLAPARADLVGYVKKPEPAFAWKLKEKSNHPLGTVYDLDLTSQTWHGITWTHQLQVYQPANVAPNATMLLYNTGGKANDLTIRLGMELARRIKAPVAFLYDIPNQPLFGNLREDALIAETFVRYLDSKGQEDDWPLLFPMVKGVVKAMDVLQAFALKEWNHPVKHFIIAGASKRGWTTWLTAATGDPRVKAIAPLVIDTLNLQKQLPYQKESFGHYSEMIDDYTKRGLVPMPDTPEARKLWAMVDPWVYRERLTLPKLLIHGNNDRYWTTDALNLYWDDLKGDKWVMYVPNAGHNLRQTDKNGIEQFLYVIDGLSAYVRHYTIDNPMPRITWTHDDHAGQLRLTIESSQPPVAARLWVATADTRDFRNAKWTEQPVTIKDGKVVGLVTPPKAGDGCLAFFGELDYELDGLKYHLSTQIRIAGTPKPAK